MNRHYIIAALMGVGLSLTAQAEETQSSSGYWSDIKTDWLGMAPGAKPFYFRAG